VNIFTALDLAGYVKRDDEPVWMSERGVILSLHAFDRVPDLPAPVEDLDALRAGLARFTAAAGAGLIEADVEPVDGVPAVRQLLKVPHPRGHGQVFLGSCTIPKSVCSAVIKVQAAEGSPTGFREALVLDRLGPDRYFQPHPYAPAADLVGGLPFHVADTAEWDAQFPDHALTLVRQALAHVIASVRLDPQFSALPAFAGQ